MMRRGCFSRLAALATEEAGDVIVARAPTRGRAVVCPACGTLTRRATAFHKRAPGAFRSMDVAYW